MASPQVQQIRIRFDSSDQQNALVWIRTGEEAIEQAKEELEQEGIEISIDGHAPTRPNEKGPVEELLITIAGEAITTLLYNVILAIFKKMHRPDKVVLQTGEHKIEINANEPAKSIQERLNTWENTSDTAAKEFIIHAFDD